MPYTNDGKHAMLEALADVALFASLHTSDTPSAGTPAEVSGGSPAYARKAVTWNPASGGSIDGDQVVFDVPGGTTVRAVGLWSAASGGTFYGYANVDDEAFTNQGTYTATDIDFDLNA